MATVTQGDFLKACDNLLVAARANGGQAVVDELRQQLERDTVGSREAQGRRNLHRAAAQQASRDLDEFLKSSRKIYSRLRHLLIALFGLDAEKLAEFGLQPFRGPKVSIEQKFLASQNRKKKPSENGVEPTRTANSQIDSAN